MGVLIRGSQENFNPQIHTEANSLTFKMQKSFAVKKKTLDLFSRYTAFQSFMYASGRFNVGANAGRVKKAGAAGEIADNAYRIAYQGALLMPAYMYGAAQIGSIFDAGNSSPDMSAVVGVTYTNGLTDSTVVTNVRGSVAIKHDPELQIFGDKFNPNDSIILGNGEGMLFIITDHPRRSSDNTHYVLDGKFVGAATLFNEDHFEEDEVATEGGNYFGEGSLRGWQRYRRTQWRINYSSIHRTTVTMTGSAKRQKVANIENNETGVKLWEYQAVLDADEIHHLMNELALRFSRLSMDPSDHTWFENYGKNKLTNTGFITESGLQAPIIGDGWIPQIEDNLTVDYDVNSGITIAQLQAMMMVLAQRSPAGSSGNEFLIITDTLGAMTVDNVLKKAIGFGNPAAGTTAVLGSNIINIRTGQTAELGFQMTTYHYLGNKISVVQDEIFNNPALMPTNGGVTGKGHMYVLNVSPVDGCPNFEMMAGMGREFIRKYENGMVSFQDNPGSVASSGFDGCSIHTLSELLPIVYDVRSCGIFRSTTKFNGGALSGNAALQGGATQFMY